MTRPVYRRWQIGFFWGGGGERGGAPPIGIRRRLRLCASRMRHAHTPTQSIYVLGDASPCAHTMLIFATDGQCSITPMKRSFMGFWASVARSQRLPILSIDPFYRLTRFIDGLGKEQKKSARNKRFMRFELRKRDSNPRPSG